MSKTKRSILFVDDDAAFLEAMERLFRLWSKDAFHIITCTTAGKAVNILQKEKVDLVVIDIRMPVIDGIQFLNLLHRRHPNLHKAVLTGYAEDHYRTACLNAGAQLFLEKGKTTDETESVYNALIALLECPVEEGFRGVLRKVGLHDVVQMECMTGNSGIIEVVGGGGKGEIFLEKGAIIHAEFGSMQSYDAFYFMMSLSGGEFAIKPFRRPEAVTMKGSWEGLLLESARLRDEVASKQEQEKSQGRRDTDRGRTAEAEPEARFTVPEEHQAPSGTMTEDVYVPPPGLTEIMVCQTDGQVIYNWQSSDPELRVTLLEFFAMKEKQLKTGMALGEVDRLEVMGWDYNAVIQLHDNGGSFVLSQGESRLSVEDLNHQLDGDIWEISDAPKEES